MLIALHFGICRISTSLLIVQLIILPVSLVILYCKLLEGVVKQCHTTRFIVLCFMIITNMMGNCSFCLLWWSLVVAQPETANTVESQPVPDPPQTRFTWRIDNFTRLNTKKLYSEVFVVGAYKWYFFLEI